MSLWTYKLNWPFLLNQCWTMSIESFLWMMMDWFFSTRTSAATIRDQCLIILQEFPIVNTWRLRQNGRHFPEDIFKCILVNENVWIFIEVQISNIPSLVQRMAWRCPGDKPLSELMMVRSLMHICATQPEWVKCQRDPLWRFYHHWWHNAMINQLRSNIDLGLKL